MFRVGDEVVCLIAGGRSKLLRVGEIYKVQATTTKRRLRGQAIWLGHQHPEKGRLWFATLTPREAKPVFRKVIRDEHKAADEEFINLLKKVKV